LSWKPTQWQAEDGFIVGTISRVADGFAWEVFSKIDGVVVTSGECDSLARARGRCAGAAGIIRDGEGG
jgi:hypothetical protein